MGDKKFGDAYLKQNGIDAEGVKDDYDCNPVSHYDIYNGETVTIKDKKGNTFEDTGMTKEKFFQTYGKDKEDEK